MAPQVLFIYNEHLATEGLLGDAFTECGFDIATFEVVPAERVNEPAGEVTFPDPTDYDVIVPLGARWPVYDERAAPDLGRRRDADDARRRATRACRPSACASAVSCWLRRSAGRSRRSATPEIGWYDVTSDDEILIPGGPWFQWHFDGWTLPPGATEIARTANSSQAFVLGRALALQFHPELDHDLLERWLADDRDGEVAGVGLSHDELRSATTELTDSAARRIRGLVRGFLSRVARQPCPS